MFGISLSDLDENVSRLGCGVRTSMEPMFGLLTRTACSREDGIYSAPGGAEMARLSGARFSELYELVPLRRCRGLTVGGGPGSFVARSISPWTISRTWRSCSRTAGWSSAIRPPTRRC
jgi:hypothetical protein